MTVSYWYYLLLVVTRSVVSRQVDMHYHLCPCL